TRQTDSRRWFKESLTLVHGLPVGVALNPTDQILVGDLANATIAYENPLDVPIENAQIDMSSDSGLLIESQSGALVTRETVPLGTLPAGFSGTIERVLYAAAPGYRGLIAQFSADDTTPGSTADDLRVVTQVCLADMNGDNLLDLTDVTVFVEAFATQDLTADSNGDGLFDLADVLAFVQAFNAGCP
ncbi:MAG: hypothetical protein K8E66_11770, partial [Phycisphaerales bacterium]|nr:hypothetical protein [Phycisphaerales bacterium]